ncbi:MAG: hypothetical protein WBP93_09915 [Pyrinomonadaceae bacterium]
MKDESAMALIESLIFDSHAFILHPSAFILALNAGQNSARLARLTGLRRALDTGLSLTGSVRKAILLKDGD